MHISTNDLHCCKPARLLQQAPSGGRPRHRPPATAPPRITPPHQQRRDCVGRLMAGRQQTAPPQQRRSKDSTAHPHQPGAHPDRPHPDRAHTRRHHPAKAKVKFPLRNRFFSVCGGQTTPHKPLLIAHVLHYPPPPTRTALY
jgi:hypothetical protein